DVTTNILSITTVAVDDLVSQAVQLAAIDRALACGINRTRSNTGDFLATGINTCLGHAWTTRNHQAGIAQGYISANLNTRIVDDRCTRLHTAGCSQINVLV